MTDGRMHWAGMGWPQEAIDGGFFLRKKKRPNTFCRQNIKFACQKKTNNQKEGEKV